MATNEKKPYSFGTQPAGSAGSREAWERLPGESARAFHAFMQYRDMAEAPTMQRVAETLHCSGANVRRWASRWNWRNRVWEFDVRQDELHREQMARKRMRMRERQAQLGVTLQEIGMQGLDE